MDENFTDICKIRLIGRYWCYTIKEKLLLKWRTRKKVKNRRNECGEQDGTCKKRRNKKNEENQ